MDGASRAGECVHVWLVNMHLDHAEEEQRAVQGQVTGDGGREQGGGGGRRGWGSGAGLVIGGGSGG
jgi:hypothetical protein